MLSDKQFQEYLLLCEQIAERMYREGIWPWGEDSTLPENLLDSSHSQIDI